MCGDISIAKDGKVIAQIERFAFTDKSGCLCIFKDAEIRSFLNTLWPGKKIEHDEVFNDYTIYLDIDVEPDK